MREAVRVLTLPLLLALLCTGSPVAESTPRATEWLEKMSQAYERSYRIGYQSETNVTQGDQSVSLTMAGTTTQADKKHMRMELDIGMSMGEMTLNIGMLGILDGETFWLESDNPMAGGKQVTRIPADQAAALSKGGPGMAGGVAGLDPVGQIEQMVQIFDFDVTDVSGGRVTLVAELPEEASADLSMMVPEGEQFTLVLDETTAFPRSMRIGGENPFMVMTFDEVEFVEPDTLDPGIFRYTPPEGVQVMDMGASISVDE